jgi:superfamily II DNA or RNA helicase
MNKENQILIELLNGVENWSDLKVKLEKYNTSQTEKTTKKTQAGKIFEVFTKYYLQTDPKKTELYKNVWLYDEVSTEIREELRLPSIDHGIDLLLRDFDNNFHAVQCKFKNDETKSLSWSGDKIANVFALGTNCHKIIVFTNASDTTSVAKAFELKFEQIAFDELNSIESELFYNILELAKGNQPKELKKHTPKEHQKEAIEKVVQHFENNDRGQLILPCGAGKTVTALWIKEVLKPKTTLVLVPSLALLKQIKNDWARHKNSSYSYLCVCSEKDIDKDSSKEDNVILHTYEIGGPVTTEVENVKSFLLKEGDKVVFSTYQSIEVIVNAVKKIQNFYFDFVICDEAHRTAGGKDKNTFTLVHYDINLPARKRLYMTATPKIVSKKLKRKLGEDYELFCDMSNPKIYGDEAYHMTFGDAISRKILVDYKIIGIGVSDLQVKKYIDERKYLGSYTAEELANNYALELVMNNYGAFHSISFHWKVEFAQAFALRHKGLFPEIFSKSVNGKQTTTYRAKTLQEFKESPKGLVSNARCLTEGVDVPSIDLIYFCDPKTSVIDIVQASGRALRLDPSGIKKEGFIVVPIFHHEDQDVEAEIKKKPIFEHLIQVIRSLCDHDERLRAEINEIAFKKGKRSNSRIRIDFPDSKIEKIIKLEGIEEKVRDVLFDEIIEKTSLNWELRFLEIKDYIEKNGNSTISKKNTDYSELYHWVGNLRKSYYEGKLESSKIKRLNEIGFDWKGENRREITDLDEIWKESYRKLEKYFEENNNSDVPARYALDKSLGTWCVSQRVKYDEEKLSDWQIELLEKLNFKWDPKNVFDKRYNELIEYKKKFGNVKVPTQGSKEYKDLGRWVNRLRVIYKSGGLDEQGNVRSSGFGHIKAHQLKLLNDIGFLWNAVKGDWYDRFAELKEYFDKNGHSNVKQAEDFSLYQWCYKQKKNKESLTSDKIEKLNSIEFNYEFQTQTGSDAGLVVWSDRLSELSDYYDSFEDYNIPRNDPEYKSLLIWLRHQRSLQLQGNLSDEKISWLEDIGFSLDDFFSTDDVENWNNNLQKLKDYFENTGSFYIAQNDEVNKSLLSWIRYQKSLFKQEKLSVEKTDKLKSIGYSFEINNRGKGVRIKNDEIDNEWLEMLNNLKAYFDKNKTFLIPNKDKTNQALSNWLRYQKSLYNTGKLSVDKEKQLLDIGYSFSLNFRGKSLNSISNELNPVEKDDKPSTWEMRFAEFKQYYFNNQTFFIPSDDKELLPLLSWLRYQRILYKEDKLENDKLEKFKELGYSFELDFRGRKGNDENSIKDDWFTRLSQLQEYFKETGTFFIKGNDKDNSDLLQWLRYQRILKKQEKLNTEQLEALSNIGYSFEIKYYGQGREKKQKIEKEKPEIERNSWDSNYLRLLNFKMKVGNCNVPRDYKDDKPLANFVVRQRAYYKQGKLNNDQINKLEFLGFEWEVDRTKVWMEAWNNKYSQLLTVFKETKSSHITSSYEDNTLYTWTLQQRMKKRNNELSAEQIKLLDDISFNWNPEGASGSPDDERWFEMLEQLEQYKKLKGNCNVSQLDKIYKKLGRWLNDQRVGCARGKLLEHRKDLLNEIGVIWNLKEHEFDSRVKMLQEFYQKNGYFEVKQSDKEYGGLYDWLYKIITKGTTEERKKKIESIGYDTSNIKTI